MRVRRELKREVQWVKDRFGFDQSGALNTGYSLEELERELDRRNKVLSRLESKAEKHFKKEKKYYEKARDATNSRKLRLFGQGKQHEIRESFYSELVENLLLQQLFLTNLVVEAKQKQIYEDPMDQLGLEVNIPEMDQEAVVDALERTGIDHGEVEDTMEEIQWGMDVEDESRLVPSIEDLRSQAHELDDIEGDGFELASELNSQVDDVIDTELERLDDDTEGLPRHGPKDGEEAKGGELD